MVRLTLVSDGDEVMRRGRGGGRPTATIAGGRPVEGHARPVPRRALVIPPDGFTGTRVLVVDGELATRETLSAALREEGFLVETSALGRDAIELFEEIRPALVLVEVLLPDVSGLDVCRTLRALGARIPIIMVSARDTELDAVVGLEIGADDYVTKPLRLREMVARVRAHLRRVDHVEGTARHPDLIASGDVRVDTRRHEVFVRGDAVAFPLKEYEILELLLANAGRVVPRSMLMARVWGPDHYGDTKTLDVHVARLRSKVEVDAAHPRWIVTVRGVGYRFERPRP
jgi:two-component system response regulator RegX3